MDPLEVLVYDDDPLASCARFSETTSPTRYLDPTEKTDLELWRYSVSNGRWSLVIKVLHTADGFKTSFLFSGDASQRTSQIRSRNSIDMLPWPSVNS